MRWRHGWLTIAGGFVTGAATFLLSVDVPTLVDQGIAAPRALPSALLGIGITAVVSGARRALTKVVDQLSGAGANDLTREPSDGE